MKDWLILVLLAMMPISELRGSIPYGILRKLPAVPVIMLSVLANIIAGILVFFFLDKVARLFLRWQFFNRFYQRMVIRAQRKIEKAVDKYGWIGVAIFIGIPLPFTGAWTGALGSYLIGLTKKKAIIAIILGVVSASIIVSVTMFTGTEVLKRLFLKTIE